MISGDPRAREYFDRLRETLESAGTIRRPKAEMGEGPDPNFLWFQTAALRRLDRGALEYGRENFMRREVNLIDEAIEETLDVAIYALLEMVKSHPDSVDAVPLGQAVYHAYQTYDKLLDYKKTLNPLGAR